MKKFLTGLYVSVTILLMPFFVSAEVAPAPNDVLTRFINNIVEKILQPIVWLLFALAMYYFVLGISMFMLKAEDPKARAKGRSQMIWGVVGIFIMVSVIFILSIVTNTFGVHLPSNVITPR